MEAVDDAAKLVVYTAFVHTLCITAKTISKRPCDKPGDVVLLVELACETFVDLRIELAVTNLEQDLAS